MAHINKIPPEIRQAIAELLSPSDTLSWALTSKENHDELIATLYRNVWLVDKKEHGWPRQLVYAALEKENSAFKKILEFTPLNFINQANVNARLIPGATAFDSKYWPLSSMIQCQDQAGYSPGDHRLQYSWELHGIPYQLMTSLLHIVSQLGDLELLEAVLAKGASNEVYDAMGYSPLFLAFRSRNRAAARMLRDAGAIPSASRNKFFRAAPLELDHLMDFEEIGTANSSGNPDN